MPIPGAGNVYSIPGGAPFAEALVEELWRRAGEDPVRLHRSLILVPHRRAVGTISEAFLRLGGGRAMLLPEIRAIGDVDEEELNVEPTVLPDTGSGDRYPPVISGLRRTLLLAQLVRAFLRESRTGPDMTVVTAEQAVNLSGDLCRFLDQMQTEGIAFAGLAGLVPEDHAEHWQQTLEFLRIVSEYWPQVLAGEGAVDPGDRRNRMLLDLALHWTSNPPDRPVTIAGSTGTVPATAELMRLVMALPLGAVVLPGLDRMLDADSWQAVGADPSHPQYTLYRLLGRLGLSRSDVVDWPVRLQSQVPAGRLNLLSEAMRPAVTTDRWRAIARDRISAADLAGFSIVTCKDLQAEAGVIALMLRQALETEGRTAALVTPDRSLARRVKAELRRWEIEIDDSAGQPLADTPELVFWRLTGLAVAEGLAPIHVLAALKHPLATGGTAPGQFRRMVRLLERTLYRGTRPAPGIDGLVGTLESSVDDRNASIYRSLAAWLKPLIEPVRAFERLLNGTDVALSDVLLAHNALVEALSQSPARDRPGSIWSGSTGVQAAGFLAELYTASRDWPAMDGRDYLPVIEALLRGLVFRPQHGTSRRLAILGPIEGRLQAYDRVILGGMNEASWPPLAPVDPWLSRPMRQELGLPASDVRIGQSAHDFVQSCSAPEVFITRSERVDGTPRVPARWLLRLEAVLRHLDLRDQVYGAASQWCGWQSTLNAPSPDHAPVAPPCPRPPLSARPRSISVTQVETWMRNPYAIYAYKILDLRSLDPLDMEPGAADRGTLMHAALEDYLRSIGPDADQQARRDTLLACGRKAFAKLLEHPAVRAFWWPRFCRVADWFVTEQDGRYRTVRRSHTEIAGSTDIVTAGGVTTLTAKADRIDEHVDGSLVIIDYKTGTVPGKAAVERGEKPQLLLEALILRDAGFDRVSPGECEEVAYWQIGGGDPPGKVTTIQDVPELVEATDRQLKRLIETFEDENTPYLCVPDPRFRPDFDDYAHLARIREWSS